jgi:hypothetical protein
MIVTVASVRACSFSGEFNTLSEATISAAIDEVTLFYRTLIAELRVTSAVATKLGSLHAAHLLHRGLKEEAAGSDEPGPVKSESLDRVGSRSFGSASKMTDPGMITDWADSPYGRRHQALWRTLPPAAAVVSPC